MSHAILDYAVMAKGKVTNKGSKSEDKKIVNKEGEKSRRKASTPKKFVASKKVIKKLASGVWTVTPGGSKVQTQNGDVVNNMNMSISLVVSDDNVLDVHAQEGDEFDEEVLIQRDNPETLKVQQEVLELEKLLQEKRLSKIKEKEGRNFKGPGKGG